MDQAYNLRGLDGGKVWREAQIHKAAVGVDAKTEKIYAMVITDGKCGDSPQFEKLVEQTFANRSYAQTVNI